MHFLAAADWTYLVDFVKPFLMMLTVLPWAWLISSKLDKDAMYFHLNRRLWNGIHLAAGSVAVILMLVIPIFWIGWPIAAIVLLGPVMVYWQVRNKVVPQEKIYKLTTAGLKTRMEERRAAKASMGAAINYIDAAGVARPIPLKEDPMFDVHLISEDLVGPAVSARAYRLDVIPGGGGYNVSQVIDGVRYRRDALTTDNANAVIDYFKGVAGMDIEERRRKQSGSCSMEGPTGPSDLTVTTIGKSTGQEMRLDFNRARHLEKPYDSLGFLPSQMEALSAFESPEGRHGVILLGTPAGHGLSTLGYSFINRHDAFTTNVKVFEKETGCQLDGVDHVLFDPSNPDLDFATNLQSILRRDPDVVLVDSIDDPKTASVLAGPGLEGPLLYVQQLNSPGVKEQIVNWVRRVGDISRAVKPMRAVINGRLLRALCGHCRQPYQPGEEQLRRLGLSSDKVQQLYKASGKVQVKNKIESCPICQGTGYMGQIGVYEVMVLDDKARKMILSNDVQGAYMHCRANKMVFRSEAALRKVVEGATTLEEVARVIAPAKAGPSSQPPKPQPATA